MPSTVPAENKDRQIGRKLFFSILCRKNAGLNEPSRVQRRFPPGNLCESRCAIVLQTTPAVGKKSTFKTKTAFRFLQRFGPNLRSTR
jgi:hypothetical protein